MFIWLDLEEVGRTENFPSLLRLYLYETKRDTEIKNKKREEREERGERETTGGDKNINNNNTDYKSRSKDL